MQIKRDKTMMIGRLKRRSDFLRVAGAGRKWVSPGLIVQIAETPADGGETAPRFGLTVTKKTEKSAVARNRIKRRLRAVAQTVLADRLNVPPHDVVLIGRSDALTMDFDALVRDFRWCLRRLDEKAGSGCKPA